jgi:hypothetical protein
MVRPRFAKDRNTPSNKHRDENYCRRRNESQRDIDRDFNRAATTSGQSHIHFNCVRLVRKSQHHPKTEKKYTEHTGEP